MLSSSGWPRSRRSRARTPPATSCCSSGPSPAEQVLDRAVTLMRAAGVTRQGDIDCIVAMTAGLTEAQLANDPGGNRWFRHLDRLVDLLVDDAMARGGTHET